MFTSSIDFDKANTDEKILFDRPLTHSIALGAVVVLPGEKTTKRIHEDEEEIYLIINGAARVTIGDETKDFVKGDAIYVPIGVWHFMECIGDDELEYLYFANWPSEYQKS